MKKLLSLTLALVLALGLAVPALGAGGYGKSITVDGIDLDLSAIPAAPEGYVPMRVICEAVDAYVDWYPEDNEAFFLVDGLGVVVNLGTMAITCDFEPVPDFEAYLDPAGYTFLPVDFLTAGYFPDVRVEEADGHYDIVTRPDRSPLEQVADAIVEASEVGATMQLDMETLADLGIDPENFTELVVLYPMMSANPTSLYLAEVAEDKMDAAKADFQALLDFVMQSFGNYPSSAELIEQGKIVESPDGAHLMLLISLNNPAGISLFNESFPRRGR